MANPLLKLQEVSFELVATDGGGGPGPAGNLFSCEVSLIPRYARISFTNGFEDQK